MHMAALEVSTAFIELFGVTARGIDPRRDRLRLHFTLSITAFL